jgi:hypothetical protein
MNYDENDRENVHKSMKNSSAIDAPANEAGAERDQGMPAIGNASGLTYMQDLVAEGGHGKATQPTPFTTVTRSKRPRSPQKNDDAIARPPLLLKNAKKSGAQRRKASKIAKQAPTFTFKDHFGAGLLPEVIPEPSDYVPSPPVPKVFPKASNPPKARTKQTVRKSTGTGEAITSSGGSSSDRSRARIWKKGCEADAKKASKPKKKTPATTSGSEGWQTDSGDESPDPERKELKEKLAEKVKGLAAKRSKTTMPGRFNGRVHATAVDGSCGPDSLLCALRHLSQTRGYNFVIPDNALALREALVNYIEENQHVEGDVEGVTLAQEIQLEYFPVKQPDDENDGEDVEQPPRQGLFNHTVDPDNYLIVDNMNEYLDLMQMPNTRIDEFMLGVFARIWSVRVAVLRTQGKGLSTDHSQFVYDQLEAERTIFLLRQSTNSWKNTQTSTQNVQKQHLSPLHHWGQGPLILG